MSALPTLQALAFYARDHFAEDGYPFESSIPSSFDLILEVYANELAARGGEVVRRRARALVAARLSSRQGYIPVAQPDVDLFVADVVTYLHDQYPSTRRAREDRLMLSHLFWGNLTEARMARGPLPAVACVCGHVMIGRHDADLAGLVRAHLADQTGAGLHGPVELPESVARTHLVRRRGPIIHEVASYAPMP